jgi:hypothetical protein
MAKYFRVVRPIAVTKTVPRDWLKYTVCGSEKAAVSVPEESYRTAERFDMSGRITKMGQAVIARATDSPADNKMLRRSLSLTAAGLRVTVGVRLVVGEGDRLRVADGDGERLSVCVGLGVRLRDSVRLGDRLREEEGEGDRLQVAVTVGDRLRL